MKAEYEPDDLLGCREAAEVARVDARTIAAWIRRGWLPAEKRPGLRGRYQIKYRDIVEVVHKPYVPQEENHAQG